MLKPPSSRGVFTKEKRNALIAIAILAALYFAVNEFFFKREPLILDNRKVIIIRNGSDTIQIDFTNWDSVKIDSFTRTRFPHPSREDDSLYKAYGLDELDSLINAPSSSLVDSMLMEVK